MKVNELINEVRIFKHNGVKVMRVETALKDLFPEDTPKVRNEADGIYITLDTIQYRDYETKKLGAFMLVFDKDVDEYKTVKKYFVEYIKTIEAPEKPTIDLTTDEEKKEV